jgi:uncharacterized protein YwgA
MTEKEKETAPDDIILILGSLLLYGKPVEGRTRLQKIVFLLKDKYEIPFSFDFKPYYYGPYSEKLSDMVSLLRALDLTEEKADYFGLGKIRYDYFLTQKGKEYFAKYSKVSGKDTKEAIRKLKEAVPKLKSLPTIELISEAKSLMGTKLRTP